jgi:HD-like signal output (HDOD) protein
MSTMTTIVKTPQRPWALDDLPPFPMVATRLLRMLSQENPEVSEVGRVIAADPVFVTRLLQMANSPLFMHDCQVQTLSHAIVLLGLSRVRSITVTRALGDFVGHAIQSKPLRECWQNSLAGALVAQKLARGCKMDPDFAYVAGLMRDIGRLALLVRYPGPYANLLAVSAENSFDLMSTERDLFDVDHCEAGMWVIGRLPLPAELLEVVSKHHVAPVGDEFRMVHLIRVADRLVDALGFGVLPVAQRPVFEDVLAEIPEAARPRLTSNAEELRAEIAGKIQSWD